MKTNEGDPNDLEAEIEHWMEEGDEADKLTFNTSSFIFVPRNLPYMPVAYRNIKGPLLLVVVVPDAGDLRKEVVNCPLIEL